MSPRASVAAVASLCLYSVLFVRAENDSGRSYVAAVYEHLVNLNPEPHVPLSREAALQHMYKSLDVYEEQAALAAGKVMGQWLSLSPCQDQRLNLSIFIMRRLRSLISLFSFRVLRSLCFLRMVLMVSTSAVHP